MYRGAVTVALCPHYGRRLGCISWKEPPLFRPNVDLLVQFLYKTCKLPKCNRVFAFFITMKCITLNSPCFATCH